MFAASKKTARRSCWCTVSAIRSPRRPTAGFTDDFVATRPEKIEARIERAVETDPDVFLNVFCINAETEMAARLHEIAVPSRVPTGENDGGRNPRLNRKIADALPNSELVILDGLKHALMIEASPLVADHLGAFLRKQ